MPEQNYANHRRLDPPYHLFVSPVVTINLFVALWFIVRSPSYLTAWNFLFACAVAILAYTVRIYALKNQNRIIRLEERLRLSQILPPDLAKRIGEIRTTDLIALRFASDEEVPDLVRAILAGEIHREEIKKRVRNWRADYLRV